MSHSSSLPSTSRTGRKMSLVPFTTQIGLTAPTQGPQGGPNVVLVYLNNMTTSKADLMKECQGYLYQYLSTTVIHDTEMHLLPRDSKYFVVPSLRDNLIKQIRTNFEKPVIYTPKAVIEARGYYGVPLPIRTLAISLSMYNCKIFLVRSCNENSLKNKIYEMCGTIVEKFSDTQLNVVITDRADDKYCSRAFGRKVHVVSKDWVEESYNHSLRDDPQYFRRDAVNTLSEHQIKPFYGLHFRINVPHSGPQIKKLIVKNQGKIVYGNEKGLTHIVAQSFDENHDHNGPKIVDLEFLEVCSRLGYYLSKKEYLDLKRRGTAATATDQDVQVKQEVISQQTQMQQPVPRIEESFTPPQPLPSLLANSVIVNGRHRFGENQAMLPPPQAPRPIRQQPDNSVGDMILKALSGMENGAQTQLASTQMRRMPEREVRFEQPVESSQQLYWL